MKSEPITASNSYTDVLPSLNVRWEVADNLILRFAASKAIARPAFSDMQAYQVLSADVRAGYTPPSRAIHRAAARPSWISPAVPPTTPTWSR